MSGETEENVSAWTIDSLHSHIIKLLDERKAFLEERDRRYEQRFEGQEKALTVALTAQREQVTVALVAINERLHVLNELRGDVATHSELSTISMRLADMKERLDREGGRDAGLNAQKHAADAEQRQQMSRLMATIAGVGLILTAVVILVNVLLSP